MNRKMTNKQWESWQKRPENDSPEEMTSAEQKSFQKMQKFLKENKRPRIGTIEHKKWLKKYNDI